MAPASEIVEIDNGGAIVNESNLLPDIPLLSVTRTVKLGAPSAAGDPLMIPVLEASVSPVGNDPEETSHTYGEIPPTAARAMEYAAPAVAPGSEVVVMVGV